MEEESSSSSKSLLLEDFGQKVDLTRRIREVLLNYPEGTTVLKELIQNADDAGATKVSLCLDRRSHPATSLLSPKLAQWQGPALLAYNNAVFTEEDFASISRVGGSGKQGQAWKTGRFGVGFNSVYHLTDLPSFVSDKYVVLFDPQGDYLPNVSTLNPGKRIEYVTSSAISKYHDQLAPYIAFGCNMKTSFPGTIFRFPLRNKEQASTSKLSKQAYLADDISSMFNSLFEEGVFTLLFLKSVVSIEMYVWDTEMPEPRKTYSCSISLADKDTVWHRQALLRLSKSMNYSDNKTDGFLLDFLSEDVNGAQSQKRVDTFYIVQTMAAASSRIGSFASSMSKDYDIHLLPWAAVAACISDNSSRDDVLKDGRAFCFLPLPVKTGMNVQINGYFEVSSNRRGIWYGADMDRSGRIRSLWNRLLLEDVVASSFVNLLLQVQPILGPTNSYYSLWPTGSFEEPWNILVEQIYKNIGDTPVLHSDLDGGKWVPLAEAFLHDNEFVKSNELGTALVQLGSPIVHLPIPLRDTLLKFASSVQLKVVTPDSVRKFLRKSKAINSLSRSLKLVLLEYCLEDLTDDDVVTNANDLPLIPLANGEFGSFFDASKGVSYFLCNDLEYMLLQKVPDRVIDQDTPQNILSRLESIAKIPNTNIFVFDINFFLQLFTKLVPADWKYKTAVLWHPELNFNHPSATWFQLFWNYLRCNTENLLSFGDYPILPSVSGHLYSPSRQLKLLNVDKLSDKMQRVLLKVGCRILDTRHGVDHPDLVNYVRDADGAGVLKSIFDVVFSNDDIKEIFLQTLEASERDELRGFFLDPKWYIGNNMSDLDKKSCIRLPIFRVYDGESVENFRYSELEDQKFLPPLDCPESLFCGDFIKTSSGTEDEILSKYYSIERMEKARFYKQYVFNKVKDLPAEFRDVIMMSVLQELPHLSAEDPTFRGQVANLEFVPCASGLLKSPAMLYDPRNEELYALLEDSDSFPAGVFEESSSLDILQGLGLRTSVSFEAVIQSARQVERLMHSDQQRAHFRGKVLLSYLEVNALKWLPDSVNHQGTMNRVFSRAASAFRAHNLKSDLEKFWNDLRLISWCPVLVSSPFESLPWPVVSSMVAPPKLVRLYSDLWLVSASMRILDGDCSSTSLSHCLGWSLPPGGSVIAAQLLELGKNNETVTDPELRQELALAMPRIYSILMNMLNSDEMDVVKAVLEGSRWIWVGDGFATPEEVVINGSLHLAPYIRVIPVDLAVFKDLFLELGIRESLKPMDYAKILCRMSTIKGSTPLNSLELRAALLIAQHLAEVQLYEEQVKIYLPDVSCVLVDATDLVYNDAPWLLGAENDASNVAVNMKRTVQKYVHGNISNDVAEKLGVHSLRRMLLAESADSMNVSLSGAAEAFGQHEALTTRLKHILEMYADGPGTLFELVQNAEDAKASEVAFLLDNTHYGTSSVLSPEMADWQGPALYCFNNSVFTPQDLYAISRIGQESKLEKPFAIGRFGLGFNCVYHFTDIPTFVSGENIVLFDPHACNLPGISPSHPGLRIKFAGRKILEQFPDQFSPFLHFGCDMQQSFPGTLFRFPLRNAKVASKSQIKKEAYSPQDVTSLLSSFADVVSETLLFLRNVKTISIFTKEGVGSEMQLLHQVHKQHMDEPGAESNTFQIMFNHMHENRDGLDKSNFFDKWRRNNENNDLGLPWKSQKLLLTEKRSSEEKSNIWLTSECFDSRHGKRNSEAKDTKSNKFIPWACVASCLKNTEAERNFMGKAFCFLPLPVSTGLPVHVNAYFELSSNRRDIWFGNDMAGGGKKRSEWNMYLLEEVAAPAYGHLLEKLTLETEYSDSFYSFWPTTAASGPWVSMMQKLYNFIADSGLRVLFTKARGGQWISTKQAIFPDFSFENVGDLIDALSDAGLPMTTIPKPHVEKFKKFCPSLHFLTPQLLRTLLVRRKREFRDRNGMLLALEYCLLDLKNPIEPDNFYGLPLLPLSNGSFTVFEKRGSSDRVYVARGDAYNLLKDSVANQLVDSEISDTIYGKLCDIAQSELFNASFLNCHLLEKLFLRLLPAEWMHAKKVTWNPGQRGQPTLEWMRLLWSYVNSHCDDLSVFSKWPILPVGNNHLLQLLENSYVIEDEGWSENMSSLLLKTGCLLLRHDLQLEHPHLNKYVQSPTASGILNALLAIACEPEKIERLFVDASEGELHELRSFILQSKWFSGGLLNESHINVLKNIPMFESFRTRKLVSLTKPTKWLKPEGILDDLLDDDFVRVESEKERKLLKKYLDIQEPSRVQFYKSYVFNRMLELVSQQSVLSNILDEIRVLIKEDSSFKKELMMTPFVLTEGGSLQEPHRLYDPRVPELQKFLQKELFPSDKFTDPETLEMLVTLGLRQTLGIQGLLDAARSVSMRYDAMDPDAVASGKRLLGILDALAFKVSTEEVEFSFNEFEGARESGTNLPDDYDYTDNLLDQTPGEEFWSELKTIRWCPVYVDPPFQGLPWLSPPQEIAAPDMVRPKSQMWLSSSLMHILDGECKSVYAQRMLGWTERLRINVLSTQLVALLNSYTQLKMNSNLDSEFEASLQEHMPVLYSNLQEYVGTDEFELLKASLNGVNWVWIGDDFVTVDALAFDSPVKYSPYLYVVPSELSVFRDLLLALGVRLNFDVFDYANVLQRLQNDVKGLPLSEDQLSFVLCVLEAVSECQFDKGMFESSNSPLLVPDFQGVLMAARDVMYNDAPWMENTTPMGKHIVHSSISDDLANRLGIQSLRSISLVSEEMTKDLPCMDYAKICDLLEQYGSKDFLLFDFIELADCCKAKKLHIIFDKREHPCQSLLQQNLGDFQGPALVAVLEGASLSREEISSLQFLPPWGLRGDMLNYGLGLMSCYSITDVPSVVSGGYLYMFDPRGMAFALPSSHSPAAKMFTLTGTNLTEQFRDQFSPMFVGQKVPWSSDSTVIRMPISSKFIEDGAESGWTEITKVFENFIKHASRTVVFLKSVSEVSLSTWEKKEPQPLQDFLIYVDPSHAALRNPFSEKKWKKFQFSNIFGPSSAVKSHIVDINLHQKGSMVVDRWLVVLSLGSGQTRNMALDRRYLAYNLTPVAGVAVHILRNGHLADIPTIRSIMSPLPLSDCISMPVAILGCFLVRHNQGRYIFMYQDSESLSKAQPNAANQLIEAWNRELMTCVRDSYVRLVLEMFKIRRDPSTSTLESRATHSINMALNACGSQIYSFWPTSSGKLIFNDNEDVHDLVLTKTLKADWNCLVDQVVKPFYYRLVDLPVWQLYSGNLVKAEEGMFLSQPGSRIGGNVLPATVCAFVKEHYPVFSVPWELVSEIQLIGFHIREIKPKMVRDLLKHSPTSIAIQSIDTYVDVLEYCLSDIQLLEPSNADGPSTSSADGPSPHESSGPSRSPTLTSPGQGDPIEMVASISRALFDFGRGVVEDMGRGGGSLTERYNFPVAGFDNRTRSVDRNLLKVATELKGLPCPTATSRLTKLGLTELWVGNEQQQSLMIPLAAKFIHPHILERPTLARIFTDYDLLSLLKLHIFSPRLLADHMSSLFHENWVNHVINSSPAPWFSWENNASSVREGGPSQNWARLFWKSLGGSHDLPLFSDWPIVPAFLGRPVLCRVKHCNLIFIPPMLADSDSENAIIKWGLEDDVACLDSLPEEVQPYMLAFKVTGKKYPWLYSLLNRCNIPIVDASFMDCVPPRSFFPAVGQSLGQTIANKLVAAKNSGYLPELTSFLASDCDQLFSLLASDFSYNGSDYTREDLEVLRDLPIYKTVTGTYKKLNIQETCIIALNTFLKPYNDRCLYYGSESVESQLVKALGVTELQDKQILVRFSLPEFENKPQSEQEDILIYLYTNWQDLQQDSQVIETLKETKFVKSADEQSEDVHKPKDLFDPGDSLLASVFSGEVQKFPGERFVSDGWLNILRKSGLQNTGDPDIVLECARRVEFLGAESMKPKSSGFVDDFEEDFSNTRSEVPLTIWSLAETLIGAIFANFAVLYSNNFCNTLGKIACVPAEKGFPSVSGKKGGKRALCSYSESILLKDWPLAWSTAPILSKQSMVPPEYSWGPLQLRSPPPFTIVLKHLQAIGRNFGEDTLAHWPNGSGLISVEEASFEIFKYLDKIWGTLSSSDVSELKQVAFIPAANGTRLVTSSSLFARLTINLSPFAFELPSLYLPFVKILKELGLQDTLSISGAMVILANLQKSCGYQRLNPNELRAVMEILHFLCGETLDSNSESELIVPDDGCRLVHANACVYIDPYGSRYVKYIDSSRLRFVHHDVSERLCSAFHIRKLSDVVVEELDTKEHLQTLEEVGSLSLAAIREKFLSSSFQAAVSNVLNTVPTTTSESKIPDFPTLQKSLESIAQKLKFVQSLYTRFWLIPKSVDITRASKDTIIPEWETGPRSSHRALYYVDRLTTCMLIAEPPSYVSVLDLVSLVVSHVLGSPIVLPISSLFLCPEGSETALINILKVSANERSTDGVGSGNGFLGRDILPQDAMQVQLHPLRPFYKGEIVAWRNQNGEKLKYGKIPENVRPSAGQALYRFNLETFPGKTETVLSSHVFSFKSLSIGNESSTHVVSDDSSNTVSSIPVDQPEGSRGVKSQNQRQPIKELEHGRVSAHELVQAVQEMLSAAGIRMDTEKQSLLQTTLSLQEQLKESKAALLLEQEKSETATKEADTAKAAWLCRICLTNEIDITVVPCGHVLCRRCSSAVSRCPFCRLQVTKTLKIYRP
ncbi:putative transcription factor C2H2 family [Helianthus annuus]|nr:putative transcription factor C2H2 family [Helianthus annuus]